MFLRSSDAAAAPTAAGDDALRPTPTTIHMVENRAQRLQCTALGGYPPPSVDLYVNRSRNGTRHVTEQLAFRHAATLTGAVPGMRRIDFRSERSTGNFRAQADDDRALLWCVVVVAGTKPAVKFVRLDIDCESTRSAALQYISTCLLAYRICQRLSFILSKVLFLSRFRSDRLTLIYTSTVRLPDLHDLCFCVNFSNTSQLLRKSQTSCAEAATICPAPLLPLWVPKRLAPPRRADPACRPQRRLPRSIRSHGHRCSCRTR